MAGLQGQRSQQMVVFRGQSEVNQRREKETVVFLIWVARAGVAFDQLEDWITFLGSDDDEDWESNGLEESCS